MLEFFDSSKIQPGPGINETSQCRTMPKLTEKSPAEFTNSFKAPSQMPTLTPAPDVAIKIQRISLATITTILTPEESIAIDDNLVPLKRKLRNFQRVHSLVHEMGSNDELPRKVAKIFPTNRAIVEEHQSPKNSTITSGNFQQTQRVENLKSQEVPRSQSRSRIKNVSHNFSKVSNIGYTNGSKSILYRCFLCKLLSNSIEKFRNHLENFTHLNNFKNAEFCEICKKSVHIKNLSDEFLHLNRHILSGETTEISKCYDNDSNYESIEDVKQKEKSEITKNTHDDIDDKLCGIFNADNIPELIQNHPEDLQLVMEELIDILSPTEEKTEANIDKSCLVISKVASLSLNNFNDEKSRSESPLSISSTKLDLDENQIEDVVWFATSPKDLDASMTKKLNAESDFSQISSEENWDKIEEIEKSSNKSRQKILTKSKESKCNKNFYDLKNYCDRKKALKKDDERILRKYNAEKQKQSTMQRLTEKRRRSEGKKVTSEQREFKRHKKLDINRSKNSPEKYKKKHHVSGAQLTEHQTKYNKNLKETNHDFYKKSNRTNSSRKRHLERNENSPKKTKFYDDVERSMNEISSRAFQEATCADHVEAVSDTKQERSGKIIATKNKSEKFHKRNYLNVKDLSKSIKHEKTPNVQKLSSNDSPKNHPENDNKMKNGDCYQMKHDECKEESSEKIQSCESKRSHLTCLEAAMTIAKNVHKNSKCDSENSAKTFKRSLSLKRRESIEPESHSVKNIRQLGIEMEPKKMDNLLMEENSSSKTSSERNKLNALEVDSAALSSSIKSTKIKTSLSSSIKSPALSLSPSRPSEESTKVQSTNINNLNPQKSSNATQNALPQTSKKSSPVAAINSPNLRSPTDQSSPNSSLESYSICPLYLSQINPHNSSKYSPTSLSQHKSVNFSPTTQVSPKIISTELLMPWENSFKHRTNWKYEIAYNSMKHPESLVALFKCMATRCSFTTNEIELIIKHLMHHEEARKKENQNDFHLYCSYCPVKFKPLKNPMNTIDQLIHHVNDIHRKDIYQCGFCFFRSCEKANVQKHFLKVHKNKTITIYECLIEKEYLSKIMSKIEERLKRKRLQFVPQLRCKLCAANFYLLDEFTDHLENHQDEGEVQKEKVDEMIQVLEKIFSTNEYGMYQCLYCFYGAKCTSIMSEHLVEHPSEYRYYCKRGLDPKREVLKNELPEDYAQNIEFTSLVRDDTDDVNIFAFVKAKQLSSCHYSQLVDSELKILLTSSTSEVTHSI